MTTDKKKTAQEDFIEQVKKLGIPVTIQGRQQLAERRQEPVETITKELEEHTRTLPDN